MYSYFVYILASKKYGTLYVGVTNNIIVRVEQHRAGEGSTFTRKHKVHLLVWYQEFAYVAEAIQREKTMKEWPRQWKINLIERDNPHWLDLYPSLPGVKPIASDWSFGGKRTAANTPSTMSSRGFTPGTHRSANANAAGHSFGGTTQRQGHRRNALRHGSRG